MNDPFQASPKILSLQNVLCLVTVMDFELVELLCIFLQFIFLTDRILYLSLVELSQNDLDRRTHRNLP